MLGIFADAIEASTSVQSWPGTATTTQSTCEDAGGPVAKNWGIRGYGACSATAVCDGHGHWANY
eukprot:7280087-Karenia_brevis.AAC.1